MSEKNEQDNPPSSVKGQKAAVKPDKETAATSPAQRAKPLPAEGPEKATASPANDKKKSPAAGTKAEKAPEARPSGRNTNERHTTSGAPAQTALVPRNGNRLALPALIVAVVAIAVAGYNHTQLRQVQQAMEQTFARTQRGENQIAALDKTVATLKSTVANSARGLDKSTVTRMIAAAVDNKATPNASDIEAMIAEQLAEREPIHRLTDEQLRTMIDQRLSDYERSSGAAQTAHSERIAALQTSEAAVKNALTALDAHSAQLKKTLTAQAETLGGKLRQTVDAPDPAVLSDALNFASIATQSGNYRTAARYLAQALSAYDSHNLNRAPYAAFKARIAAAKDALEALAEQENGAAMMADLGAEVANWPFRSGNTENEIASTARSGQNGFLATMERAGKTILGKAFTVTRNDATGLTWINADKRLQGIVRENVRLDLAYARALAMRHDSEALSNAVTALKRRIVRYFDSRDDTVKTALDRLDQATRSIGGAPDIAALADALGKAAGE